jgi:DNA polymerase III epsilon subunit-like protein
MSLPRGYYDKVLSMDCETSGLKFNSIDPSDGYQSISWGLIVADAATFKPIDELYVEIQWDGKSNWDKRAEEVHGMSKEYLAKNGVDNESAVADIAEFIFKYWPPDAQTSSNRNVRCLGHNVASFDIWFMRRLLEPHGLMFKTGNRYIDTSGVANVLLGTFNSDDMFAELGLAAREKHNSLEDARMTLESARRMRMIFQKCIGE